MRTLPLADEFFLVGHDEYTGKPQVSGVALDSGLAGAVLGELLLDGRLGVEDGVVVVRERRGIAERVSDAALGDIIKHRDPRPVRGWVEHLRREVRDMVGRRLVEEGLVRRQRTRGLVRTSLRFPARDPLAAASPRVRLRYLLDHPEQVDTPTAVLAALVASTRLEHVLAVESTRAARETIAELARDLPAGLSALAKGVDAAVGTVTLTIRR